MARAPAIAGRASSSIATEEWRVQVNQHVREPPNIRAYDVTAGHQFREPNSDALSVATIIS